ncbi:Rv1733c family protein [Streptomyces sviceus]|uniref:Rv1733c family protein n=1 Tax=Streptomyces sviceus TaxID=285530 RepID=UPI00369F8FA8
MGAKAARKRFWRWRSNPLRRRDDIVEAWIVLAVWAVVAVGGTAAGLVTARAADEVFARQRVERHPVRAVLLTDVSERAATIRSSSDKVLARIRWTAPDGSARTDETLVETGLRAGTHVLVWQDGHGRLVTEPPTTTEAAVEAAVMGTGAALALAGAVHAAGAVARRRLDRRRVDAWGREWDLVGPQWGHRTG